MKTLLILANLLYFTTLGFSQVPTTLEQDSLQMTIITDKDNKIENIIITKQLPNGKKITTKYLQTLTLVDGIDSIIINDEFLILLKEGKIQLDTHANKGTSLLVKTENNTDTTNFQIENLKIQIQNNNNSEGYGDWSASTFEFKNNGNEKKGRRLTTGSIGHTWSGNFDGHYDSFDYGVTIFTTPKNNSDTSELLSIDEGRSYEISFCFFNTGIGLIPNRLGLVTGIATVWNSYRFNNSSVMFNNSEHNTLGYSIDTSRSWKKSKISTFKITVPLLIEAQLVSGFWLQAGAFGSVKLGSKTKMKAEDGHKHVVRGSWHMNPLQYGLMARVGYENLGIYATYHISSLFKNNEAPEIYPLSVGLVLSFH